MHDRIRRNSNGIFKEREEIKPKVEQEKVIVNWNPSFQPEDFSEHGKDSSQVAGPSERKHEEEKKDKGEEGTELDLKLSFTSGNLEELCGNGCGLYSLSKLSKQNLDQEEI
ncbi:hypothetical protein POTOM_044851 [Populus tomentosa]|uniref:Uncharacterized protein n=1 Tax=Populus tomentosa TaxID=118781 RepID=A0A8X7YGT4_POPTO|nr:hypothetical protein POTOM_044851 [Populus tomentosa]